MELEEFKAIMKSHKLKVKVKKVRFSINGMYGTGLGVYDKNILINPSCMSDELYNKYKDVIPIIHSFMREHFYNHIDAE